MRLPFFISAVNSSRGRGGGPLTDAPAVAVAPLTGVDGCTALSLARAGFQVLLAAEAEPDATAARTSRFAPLLAALRWPATALATAAVLWYMPGRPEGLVAGVLVALAGFTAAALQSARDLNHANPGPDDPDDTSA